MFSLSKVALFCLLLGLPASANPWSVGPAPSWVASVAPDTAGATVSEGGYRSLLNDDQILDAPGKNVRFTHRVYVLESIEGTRAFDGISVNFDPAWQKVTLHWIRVRREGKLIDKLDLRKIRVLQREENLESGQINDSKTLHGVLEDLRAGDELDYAWTIEGVHPAFPGVFSGSFFLEMPWIVERLHFRIVWQHTDSLQTLSHHGAPQPVRDRVEGRQILTWDLRHLAASKFDDKTPAWWDDRPVVDWTNLADWSALAATQVPFYAADGLKPEVAGLANRIAKTAETPEARVIATLRFMQDSIRYLGYEGGLGSHIPRPPVTTLALRQGDCKDKTFLMVTLLRAQGIEAHPVLVKSQGDRELKDRLPSPWWFDHVVVGVRLAKRLVLLDPTDVDQRGALEDIPQVGANQVVVLEPQSQGLLEIPDREIEIPEYDLLEIWDASRGPGYPARLERLLVRRGRTAEIFRTRLSRSSAKTEIDAEFDRLKATYPGLRRDSVPTWEEDSATGDVTWRSLFASDSFWKPSGTSVWKLSVSSPMMRDLAEDPDDFSERRSPLALAHPNLIRVKIEVRLPEREWSSSVEEYSPKLTALDFQFRSDLRPSNFELEWNWKTLSDRVELASLPIWKATMDSIRGKAEWTITLDTRPWSATFNWTVALLCLAILGGGIWAVLRLERWSPQRLAVVPVGAIAHRSGWWALYALGMTAVPIRTMYSFFQDKWIFDAGLWNNATEGQGGLSVLLLCETGMQILVVPFWALLHWLFWNRRSSFPRLNAIFMGSLMGWLLVDTALAWSISEVGARETLSQVTTSAPSGLIWALYFLFSNRSVAVFRNSRRGTEVMNASGDASLSRLESETMEETVAIEKGEEGAGEKTVPSDGGETGARTSLEA